MQIECRSCGEVVPSRNLNLDRMVAKCASCHGVFRFEADPGATTESPERRRASVVQPKSVTVEEHGGELVLTTRWRNGCAIAILVPFALVWNVFVWGVAVNALDANAALFRWFLVPFQLVGLALGYLVLAIFFNRTTATVDRQTLRVRHGPLPLVRGVELDTTEIDQLFVRQRISGSTSNNGSRSVRVNYSLEAELKSGGRKPILHTIADVDDALWFEQVLEERLGIVDRPVRGEV